MAARKKKSVPELETVEGVTLAKVDAKVFEVAYARALTAPGRSGITLPSAKAPLTERVKTLVLWYRATTAAGDLAGCSECGGDSDISLDMCPFCGDHEVVDEQGNLVAGAGTTDVTEPEVQDPPALADGTVVATPEELAEAPVPPAPKALNGASKGVKGETLAPAGKARQRVSQGAAKAEPAAPPPELPATEPPSKPARKLKRAGSPEAVAKHAELDAGAADAVARDRDPQPHTVSPPLTAAQVEALPDDAQKRRLKTATEDIVEANAEVVPLGEDQGVPTAGFTAKDLDKSVQRISKLKVDTANSLWELGREIKKVLDNRLWMLRTVNGGTPKHRTFKQFVVGELDMSYMHAHRLVTVSESFTEQEMKQVGVTKCHLMLQVPKEKRQGLLDHAAAGASVAQISSEVATLTQKDRPQPPPKTAKPITVAMAQGRIELPLFARPKGRHGYPSEAEQKFNPRKAQSINDDPFAIEMLPNDVRVLYNVVKDVDGTWVLIIERRRAKEDELFNAPGAGGVDEEASP